MTSLDTLAHGMVLHLLAAMTGWGLVQWLLLACLAALVLVLGIMLWVQPY